MPSVILVFSTLLLDENLQQPVVLPKQDIQLHLSPKVRQDANLPVFHFLTVCQTNTKHQSLMVIDSEHEIQFGVHQPNSAPVEGGLVSTIITLYQPPQKSEYVPHLVGNVFENVVQIKDLIYSDGYLSTRPDPIIQCKWNSSQAIPIPMQGGNLFFPSFPFHNLNDLSNPFYDISPIPFRYANAKLCNINPPEHPHPEGSCMINNFALCDNITQPCQYIFYDEIISEVIMKKLKTEEITRMNEQYIYCPFIFPAQCNLHHVIIYPDTLCIQQQKPTFNIFREHRSPAFNIISRISFTTVMGGSAITLSPVCLYAFIQGKELIFRFNNHISATYKITDHKENYLSLFSRNPRKQLTTKLWESDAVSFDYLISNLDPIRLNLDGSTESPVKFLQPRTINMDKFSPAPTVSQLCTSFAPCSLGPIDPRDTSKRDTLDENFEENLITDMSLNLQCDTQLEPEKPKRGQNDQIETNSIENSQNYSNSSTERDPVLNTAPTTSTSPAFSFEIDSNEDLPDIDLLDSDFMFEESNPNFIPLNDSEGSNMDACLSDFLENEYRPKFQRQHSRVLPSPYSNRSRLPKPFIPRTIEEERSALDAEVRDCLMELDNFLDSLETSQEEELNTPSDSNQDNSSLAAEDGMTTSVTQRNDDPVPAESSPREEILSTPTEDPTEQHSMHYDVCALTIAEKSLFLFETEFNDQSVNEQQVPKLLAKIKLGNEHGQFESITALVDSGSDVSLITMDRLRSLVSQEFISDNIEKENAVLTSFTNTGIKIEGKLQLRFKLNDNGPVKTWKFLVISQSSLIDFIIGNDILMFFCMSIQVKTKNKPEIVLPDGEPVATFYSRINELNECQKDIRLKPKQKAYIKIVPHPAFTAFRNERLLVEGTMDSAHIVVPLACKILPCGRLPLAVVNHSNREILEKVRITITRMAPDQRVIGHRDIKDIQVYTLMVPVQLSNRNEGLEIKSAECTKEINVYKMDVQHIPPESVMPQRDGSAEKVKVSKRETRVRTDGPTQQRPVLNSREQIPPRSVMPQRVGSAKVKVSKRETRVKTNGLPERRPVLSSEEQMPPTSVSPKGTELSKQVKGSNEDIRTGTKGPTKQRSVLYPTNATQEGISHITSEECSPDEENKYSPENFWKDMDGKFLPPGYEVFQNSTIEDIVKLEEYPPSIRKYIKDIFIDKYSQIISKNDYEIGQLSRTLGPIKLHLKPGTKLPPFRKIYYLEDTQAQALRDILSYLIKEGIIEKCPVNDNTGFNGFSSPAYLVSKANPEKSAYRLIVNYKNLNNELLLTPPILPSISQYLQKLRRGYVFSQFDLSSAFYSLQLDKESRKLTMFSTCFGNYKFRSLAMGLATSPGAFCHIANDLIHTEPVLDKEGKPIFTAPGMVKRINSPLDFACIYFDDVCIFSTLQPTYEETVKVHFDYVEQVMKRLAFHVAKIKWSKTELLRTEIIFLGHKISNGKAYADPRRVEKLLNAKFPTNLNLLRSFLGLLNSLRSYLPPVISKNMTTLQELTSTKKGFHPAEKHHQAFDSLKLSLTKEPLFTSIIDPAGHYYLFCDAASGEKANFSAVLTQVIRDKENEYPPFLNKCDPIHDYIYCQDLRYRPIPLYLGTERVCKTKVDRKTYDPIFIPSYYEKKNLGYSDSNLIRTWFIAIQSIYYDMNCKFLDEAEVRKEATLLCRKGLLSHKIKSFCHGGHHVQAKQFLQDFQDGKTNVDNFLFLLEAIAEAIRRTMILIIMDETESVSIKVLNANEKSELIIGVYTVGNQKLFYPFKRVDADTLKVYDFQDRIQIVGFYSKSIPQGTSLLDIAQIEALGLLYTLDHYRPYIKMSKLTLITDNLVFFAILSKKVLDCSSILARYALKILLSYPQCRIRHVLTSQNLADFLTRENKIDRNTLLRLPLSAFTVDNELSRKINQKREYTFLEMRDFCDENQNFIHIQPDVMGRKKVAVRKHDNIESETSKTLLSLTYDDNSEGKYYETEEVIVTLLNDHDPTYVNENPFYSIDSVCPELTSTRQVAAVTRSGKETQPNIEPVEPKPGKSQKKKNRRVAKPTEKGVDTSTVTTGLPPLGEFFNKGQTKDKIQPSKEESTQLRKSRRKNGTKQQAQETAKQHNMKHMTKNVENPATTVALFDKGEVAHQTQDIQEPQELGMEAANKPTSLDTQLHSIPKTAEHPIETTAETPMLDTRKEKSNTATETNTATSHQETVPTPYLYQGHNQTDPDLAKAEYELDKISHPNPKINNSGQATYPKVDPYRAQQSLVELLILRTNHPNLIAGQKEEYNQIIEECRQSNDFRVSKSKGVYFLKNSLLYFQEEGKEEKIVLPSALRGFVISAMHIIKQHAGVKRMINELAIYHIPGLSKLLELYLSSCFTCFLNNRQKSAQLGHVPIVRPGYCFHVDLAEGLPPNNGYKHILLCVDPFTKMLLTYPLKEKTAAQVLPYMIHTIFQMFHCRILISDGGPAFIHKDFKKAMKDLYINHKIVAAHHPQSNSHAESKVKRLKDMLRKMLASETSTDWLVRLPLATKVLNCCKLGEISLSPLEILYGANSPNSQHTLTTPSQHLELPPYKNASEIQAEMKPIITRYKKLINERNVNRKKKINKNLKNPQLKVGSYVIIKDFAILKGINRVLHNIYRNEFFVVERVKPRSIVAKSLTTFQSKLIAYSHVKVVNESNYAKLDVPPVLWKLLVKDSRMLTQADKLFISSNTQALILPEPPPEAIEDFLSESEDKLEEDDPRKSRTVRFDLENDQSNNNDNSETEKV